VGGNGIEMKCLREDSKIKYSACIEDLITEAQPIEHDVVLEDYHRHQNPQLSVSSASSQKEDEDDRNLYEAFVARTSARNECFNCGEIGHYWYNCKEKMESCFKCRTTFRNPKEYHHPRDYTKFTQTGLKKRPNFSPENSTSSNL